MKKAGCQPAILSRDSHGAGLLKEPLHNCRGSEREFYAKLDATPIAAGQVLPETLVHLLAGRVEAGDRIDADSGAIRAAELRVIERIVRFESELDRPCAFMPLEVLHEREVPVVDSRAAESVFGRVAQPILLEVRRNDHGRVKCLQRSPLVLGKNRVGRNVRPYSRKGRIAVNVNSQTAPAGDIGSRYERIGESHRLAAHEGAD